MGNVTLSTAASVVNNETIKIVPNSAVYDGGEGEINVRSASAGGGSSSSVHSQNAETKIGKFKFDVFLTSDLDQKIATWKENIGANSIQANQGSQGNDSISLSFDNMSLVNLVEREVSADGVTSLEFEGDPMSIQ
jgi:hypothetical protein